MQIIKDKPYKYNHIKLTLSIVIKHHPIKKSWQGSMQFKDKGLIFVIYKEIFQSNKKKETTKDNNRHRN